MKRVPRLPLAALAGLALGTSARAEITAEQRTFFEKKIRPVLVEQCYECHAAGTKKKKNGGLLLDTPEALAEGGESGPPIVPGRPGNSLFMDALHWSGDLEMPPEEPLPEQVVADFVKWIEMGAPDPRASDPAKAKPGDDSEAPAKTWTTEELWSFQPIRDPAPPEVSEPDHADWPRADLDRFVLARLTEHGLAPAPDADPATLIRRLSFDLLGLPPTLAEVETFVSAFEKTGHGATEELVDRLLASPHFGERWGRHWLDVVRFGESNGNDGLSRNPTFPHAWRYRDYVIDALNRDLPYDRFLQEQIAGDLLKAETEEERDRLLVATGMLAIGSKPAKAMNNNFEMDVVDDQINVLSTGVMGLSVACARCHDHKFDPIPTRDYYALAGIFKSTQTLWGLAAKVKLTAPQTPLHVLKTLPAPSPPPEIAARIKAIESIRPDQIQAPEKDKVYPPGTALAMGVREAAKPAHCKINLKGDAKKLGKSVPRGLLSAHAEVAPPVRPIGEKESGRLQLAEWLGSAEHPQTARVLANRIWLHLHGRGIVNTPDEFGVYGERPTHPELLDHLATRLVQTHGWSLKSMIREIVLSRSYGLASRVSEDLIEADPENLWVARHTRRRLDAESLRDSMLKASGALDPKPAEGSLIRHLDVLMNYAGNLHEPSNHRSVYLCYLRNSPPPELAAFDLPDGVKVAGKRNQTTLPTQALFLLNSPFVRDQGKQLAASLDDEAAAEPRIREAFRRTLLREPTTGEIQDALTLLQELPHLEAWPAFCQSLLASSEFRYVD